MPVLTISQGERANAYQGPDGTFPVTLVEVGEPIHKPLKPGDEPRTCKVHNELGYDLMEWTFAIDAPGTEFDGQCIWGKTSTATGPKSKLFGWLQALTGRTPTVGVSFDTSKLHGRSANLTVKQNPEGFMDIINLAEVPSLPTTKAAAKPAAADTADDLPF